MYINRGLIIFKEILAISLLLPSILFAHSGSTDAYGGHNNRKTGGYHYHNAGYSHAAGNPYQNHKTCGICVKKTVINKQPTKVYFIQSSLKLLGYYTGHVDGKWGSGTVSAIKAFQRSEGLAVTGVVDGSSKKVLLTRLERIGL